MSYIAQFQIIAFVETFITEKAPDIAGFSEISHRKATKRAKNKIFTKKEGSGRASGGISVYARDDFSKKCCPIQIEDHCNNIVFCKSLDWAIGFAYFPPETSEYKINGWDTIN